MKLFICQSCGHITFDVKPDKCPVCAMSVFEQNDAVFKESEEKSKEGAVKHIPSISVNTACGFIPENDCVDVMVRIGTTLHPMVENHFIRFIDCYLDLKYVGRVQLTPGINPAACFHLKEKGKTVTIVENCSIHGYWMADREII
jgi:desulfoferrodoxin-like iron-binding protein